ncbi:MlaD family protein [Telluribacter sp. SYSU D00476]|uniref:MlaD family protein n=1 Tax=Telluribacter sp. SYSU D00476 TaxID=2811430 RepID=UPI001FF6EF20|nr:MlaD family protein [Telluribacter sp. SYSU D00476]
MKLSKEAKVGLLAIVTMTMLYFGFNFLKGSDLLSRTNKYYVVYDNIDGLAASNPVLLNGLSIGQVSEISIMQNRGNRLLVTLDVNKDIQVHKGTVAVLDDGGLLGGKVIRLDMAATGPLLEGQDTLVGRREAGISALLQEKALPVIDQADSLMAHLNMVAMGFRETGTILNQVLRNYDQTGQVLQGTLQDNRANLAALTSNLNQLTASLVQTEKELKPLMVKTNTFADSLNALRLGETLAATRQTINEMKGILTEIKSGDGTLGKLANDQALYNNLNYTLLSMNKLMTNLRENPSRYLHFSVFGKKDKGTAETAIDTTVKIKSLDPEPTQ